jgi:hypothetical protein
MPDRALIIAIEKYEEAKGLAPVSLSGVRATAHEFVDWITGIKKIPLQNIYICSDATSGGLMHEIAGDISGAVKPFIYGATRAQIRKAILDLLKAGSGKTENFFLYAAGHGFEYVDGFQQPGASMLITSEYQDMQTGGDACINLDELQLKLPTLLSGLCHFYFVDACRNRVRGDQISPVSLGLSFQSPGLGDATQFTLYSAGSGETAAADATFSNTLLGGLRGAGHAKMRSRGKMLVTFPAVCSHITDVLNKPVDKRIKGPQVGQIDELTPPVMQRCTLTIADAEDDDIYTATFASGGLTETVHFTGSTCMHPLAPNDAGYHVQVTKDGKALLQESPAAETFIDMYDDWMLVFSAAPPAHGRVLSEAYAPVEDTAGILHVSLSRTGIDPVWSLFREDSKGFYSLELDQSHVLPPGLHTIHLKEDGVSIWKNTVRIRPGETVSVGETAPTSFQQDVIGLFGQEGTHSPEISELLGKTADWDVNLWLAVLGTANIRPVEGYYRRLNLIDVPNAPDLEKDSSGLLILVVSENEAPAFAVHEGKSVTWRPLRPVSNVGTLFFAYAPLPPEAWFVSLKFREKQVLTYTTSRETGAYTLFTVTAGTPLSVQQIFVPTPAKEPAWSPAELTDLKLAKALSTAQRLHRERQPIFECPFLPEPVWTALSAHTWNNTQLILLAAYDLRRQGRRGEFKTLLAAAEAQGAWSGDLRALKEVAAGETVPTKNRPLLLDTLLLDPDYNDRTSVFSMTRLNFDDIWVSWYAAISEADQKAEE